MILFVMLYKVVPAFQIMDEMLSVVIQATAQHFPVVVLFVN